MKWLVDTMGWDELQARILKERKLPAGVARRGPAASPTSVAEARRRARRRRPTASTPTADRPGHAGHAPPRRPVRALGRRQRRARRRPRAPCRPTPTPASATSPPTSSGRWPSIQRELGAEVRVTNRQNLVFRGLTEAQLPTLLRAPRRHRHGRARRRAGPRRRRLPGRRHLQPGRHPEPRPGRRHRRRPRGGRPGRRRRRPHQHLRLHQLLRPAPHRRHRVLRRRAPGPRPVRPRLPDAARRLRRPGADPLRREGAAPAGQERRPRPRCGSCGASPTSARPARRSASWLDRVRRRQGASPTSLKDLDEFPTPDEGPEFYVDYDETGPYVAEIGDSECAT